MGEAEGVAHRYAVTVFFSGGSKMKFASKMMLPRALSLFFSISPSALFPEESR